MSEDQKQKSQSALREEAVLKFWKENKIFEKTLEKDSPKGEFVFFEGPPTANAKPALHHLEARAFKDVIPRYKTMRGYHVGRRGGWDTHGLPVELQIEKKLGLNSKKAIEEYGIEKFNAECKQSVFEYIKDWEEFTDRIGYWVDKEKAYFTFNNSYIESLWNVLAEVEKKGLLYKDYRIVPWCARCGTPLASHELAQGYEDVKDLSIFVKFKVVGEENTYLLAWTTTPWTLPGNVALAVNGKTEYSTWEIIVSERKNHEQQSEKKERIILESSLALKLFSLEDFKPVIRGGPGPDDTQTEFKVVDRFSGDKLAGLSYEPLYNFITPNDKSHKVYAADFVTTEDGTGIVHIAPMYGQDDFELGTKVGLPKEHVVGLDGKFLPNTGFFSGRFAMEKDEAGKPTLAVDVIKDLQGRGLFFDKKNYEHTYPHCWRCKTPLLYYARDSWYIKMESLKDELVKQNENINWEPSHIKEGRFGEWLKGIKDWAISRERYWGTPLPVWMSEDGDRIVVDSIETLKKYSKDKLTKITFVRHGQAEHNVLLMSSSALDKHPLTEKGEKQAKETASRLLKEEIDVVFSSPILRAKQTAEIYTKKSSKNILFDDRLGEIKSGYWEEKTQNDPSIKKQRDDYKALSSEERYKFKRGENGESWEDLEKRVSEFLIEVIQNNKGKNILCFSHQGAIEVALKMLKKLSNDEADKLFHQIDNGEDFSVYVDSEKIKELDLHRPFIDDVVLYKDGKEYRRVKEVMDVWFDSGAMPFAQDHYPFENKEPEGLIGKIFGSKQKLSYPADFISEAIDQTRGWFYTLHAVGVLMGRGNAYKNVICLGHILDAQGKKMSKSIGNIVNPWEMMDKYGVDTLRLWMYSVNQPGESKNFDEKTVAELHSKIFNLFYNVISFYELYRDKNIEEGIRPESQNILDTWILSRLDELILKVTQNLDGYKLMEPVRAIRDFIDDLSTWYLRRSRDRIKDGDLEAKKTLYFVIKNVAKILAPFAPFAAEDVWQKFKLQVEEESIHLTDWPKAEKSDVKVLEDMRSIRELVTAGLEQRQKAGIKVRQPLSKLEVSSDIVKLNMAYVEIAKDELNVKEIVSGDALKLDTEITPELKKEGDFRELLRNIQGLRKDKNLLPNEFVNLTLPENQKEIISGFEEELKKTAGIKEIKFGGQEIIIEK